VLIHILETNTGLNDDLFTFAHGWKGLILCRAPILLSTRSAPNSLGSLRPQIRTNAAVAISDAARKLDTRQELAPALSQRSFGRSGGNITVSRAVNRDGAALNLAAT
jgi:hypothetical protein